MLGITAHSSASEEDVLAVKKIFSSLGKCEVVPEYLIPSISGLAGSGIAYVSIAADYATKLL